MCRWRQGSWESLEGVLPSLSFPAAPSPSGVPSSSFLRCLASLSLSPCPCTGVVMPASPPPSCSSPPAAVGGGRGWGLAGLRGRLRPPDATASKLSAPMGLTPAPRPLLCRTLGVASPSRGVSAILEGPEAAGRPPSAACARCVGWVVLVGLGG